MGSSRFLRGLMILITVAGAGLNLKAQTTADFNIVAPFPNCNPAVYSFNNTSTGTPPLSYEWNFGVYPGINSVFENPGTTYINCGDFNVKLVVTDGLGNKDSVIKPITVRCSPEAYFTTVSGTGCIPYNAVFTDSSTAGSGSITNYFWDFGDGYTGSGASPSHIYTETGCKNLTLIVTNTYNCTSDTTLNNLLCIQTPPVAGFTSDDSVSCSSPFVVTYAPDVSGGSGNYSYQWIFEGGNPSSDTGENPVITYTTPGVYTTTLIVTDALGCTDTLIKTGHITLSDPVADFTMSRTEGCTSDIFAVQAVDGNDVSSRQWTVTPYADVYGADSVNAYFVFGNEGSFDICLTTTYSHGCTANKCTTIVVHDNPVAHFNYSGLLNTCIRPDTISFINTSTGNNLTYNWSFPGASPSSSTDENPSIAYNNCGNYSSALTVTDRFGCQSTYTENNFITLYCPTAAFTIHPSSGCYPLTVSFSDSGSSGQPVSWNWDFGDTTSGNDNTSTLQSPTHTYNQKGCYTVTLTTVNAEGCTATATLPAAVCAGDKPVADFTGSPSVSCANLPVLFTNLSDNVDTNTVYTWDFHGDDFNMEGTGANPSYTYGDTGVWDVTLVVTNFGCTDTVRKIGLIETVPPIAVPEIIRNCEDQMVITLDGSRSVGALGYSWNIPGGNPSSASTPAVTVTYTVEGNYTATLTVHNDSTGCSDTQEISFNIEHLMADFTGSPLSGCAPLNSCMNNISSGAAGYQWTVTDTSGILAASSTGASPCFNLSRAGVYNVRLIVLNSYGCSDTLYRNDYITVYSPMAVFSVNPFSGCPPLFVHFTDSSYSENTTLLSWNWNFGDPASSDNLSALQNPDHVFNLPGDYTVHLTVTDDKGCSNTAGNDVHAIKPVASFVAGQTDICKLSSVCFSNHSTGGNLSYEWDFGDGNNSTAMSPCHVYDTTGKFTVTLITTDSSGCRDTATYADYISVTKPVADFTADNTSSSCPPLLVTFTNFSTSPDSHTSYLWKFGDGQVSSVSNPSHIYNLPGDFDVTLIVTNANGCKDTLLLENYIHVGGPTAKITTPPTSGCTPHYTCFSATSTSTISFVWNFGDGSVQSIGESVCYTYTRTGNFYPELILNDGIGCIYAMPVGTVSIHDVVALFKADDSVSCNKTIRFTDSSYGTSSIQNHTWDFGDPLSGSGNTSNLKNPSHTFSGPGVYQVTETVTSVSGCSHSVSHSITIHASPVIASLTATGDTCTAHQATATVSVTGGNPAYQYVWNTSPAQTAPVATGLSGGNNYSVTVTDANGCTVSGNRDVMDLHPPHITVSGIPATCESDNGSVTVTVTSGNAPYTYNWNSGSYFIPAISSLPSGSYSVTVTDKWGCRSTGNTVVTEIPRLRLAASVTDDICGKGKGIITLTVSEGSAPFSYQWSNGTTAKDISNLSASIYAVTVTDFYQCTVTDSFAVDGNDSLMLIHASSAITCGMNNGNIMETVTGGTLPYTFNWDNGTYNTKDISNLPAGQHTLVLTDSSGCSAVDTVLIGNILPPELSSYANNTTCGKNNGSAWVSVAGGIEPYTYLWSNGGTDYVIDSIYTGDYTVTVTDSSGCIAINTVTVYDLPGPSVSYSTTPYTCGWNNGAITLTVTDGAIPYSYQWSTGAATESISHLSAGTYYSTVTDGNGCEVFTTLIVNGSYAPVVSLNHTNASCSSTNGSVSAVVIDGTAPYTFLWSNGSTSQNISNIPAGTYTLETTDVNGCTATQSAEVIALSSSPVITVTPSSNIVCNNRSTILTASGANSYQWMPATGLNKTTGSSVTATPTVTTTYTVTGTASSGCTGSSIVVIMAQPPPAISVTGNASVCPGSTTTLTASGAYTYQWSPSTALNVTSGSIVVSSPSFAITYTVTGTDINGCTATATLRVSKASNPVISLTPSHPILCYGNAATMTASGALTYIWSPASGLSQTSGASVIASPTVTTTYTVTGTDANGCTSSSFTTITSVSPAPVDAGPGGEICIGSSMPLQGNGALQYRWSPVTGLNNPTVSNPVASPTVTTTYYITGSVPTGNLITNGDFNAGNTGFSSAYTYATNLNPEGLYWVGTDAHNVHSNFFCKDHTTGSGKMMVVNGAPNPNVDVWCQTISVVPNSMYDFSTWVQTVSPAANPALLQFSVNGVKLGSPFAALSDLCNWKQFHATWNSDANTTATICIVNQNTIRNGNDFALDDISFSVLCESMDSVVVIVNPEPVISANTSSSLLCMGSATDITAAGASSYQWSPSTGLNTTTGSSVTASPTVTTTYTVTGTDSKGCTGSTTVVIHVLPKPSISIYSTTPSFCSGNNSTLTASGASFYSWLPAAGLSATSGARVTATNTVTTTYTVTGTDVHGCTNTSISVVTVLPNPIISVTPSHPSICFGSSTTMTASGADSYVWAPDLFINSTTGASVTVHPTISTSYTVTGSNSSGCTASAVAEVNIGGNISIQITPANSSICPGGSDTLSVTGADVYAWTPSTGLNKTSGATVIASPSVSVTYTVTGTDWTGCTGSETVTVIVNPLPIISVNQSAPDLCAGDSILLVVTGASAYHWTPMSNLNIISMDSVFAHPSVNSTYTVIGKDINGCTASAHAVININQPPVLNLSAGDTSLCFGESTTLTVSGAASYLWTPSTTLSDSTGANVNAYPTENTTYYVTGENMNGCKSNDSVAIKVFPPVVLNVTPYNPTICNGSSVILNASGAESYSWMPATGLNVTTGSVVTASPTVTTTYTITGTDRSGCMGMNALIVTVADFISLNVTANPSSICFGDSTLLTVSGALHYTWSPLSSLNSYTGETVTATPLINTTYTVKGTDAIGCTGIAEVPVTVLSLPPVQAAPDSILTCAGSSVILSVTGGLSYIWSPGDYLNKTDDSMVISHPLADIVYTVTGTDNNGCVNSDSVSVKVKHGTPITVSPVADTVCAGQSTVLTASGGISYQWSPSVGLSDTTGNRVFATPNFTTTYTVTGIDSSGCESSATTVITVNAIPGITVINNPTICAGSSVILSATGGVVYTWSPSVGLSATTGRDVTANPISTTTYIVSGENEHGCSNFTTVTVTVADRLSIQINSDSVFICKGNTVTLNAYGADNYTWSPSLNLSDSMGQSVTARPDHTTTYTITGSDANGCSGDTTVIVSVNPNPDVNSSSHSACSGDSVLLTATGAVNYLWSPAIGLSNSNESSVTAYTLVSVTYTITGTNEFGCTDTATSLVTVNPSPLVTITDNPSLICSNSPPLNLSATPAGGIFTGTGVTGNVFYPDSIGAGNQAVIRYSYTNTYSCSGTDSIIVTVYPSPGITVTPNAETICTNSSTPLSVRGADTYQWTPATGLNSTTDSTIIASPGMTTTYSVTGMNYSGCTSSTEVVVTVSPLPVVTVSPSVTSICNGSSAILSASGAESYQWTPSTGLTSDTGAIVTANPSASTTYAVIGTDSLGCYSVATATVNVGAPVHIINTPTNPVICKLDSVNIALAGAATYTWTPSTGLSATTGANVTASPSATTSYTVTGIDSNGCSGQVSFEVKVNPELRISGYTTTICKGNSTVLNATGADMFMWSIDSTLSSLYSATVTATPNTSSTYTVTGWNSFGCSDTAQFAVIMHPLPVVSFTGLKPDYCISGSADTLTGIPSGGAFTGIGINGNIFYPLTAGIGGPYAVTYSYTDSFGCSDTTTQFVHVNKGATLTAAADNSTICTGTSTVLTASGAENYLWTPETGLNVTTGNSITATPTANTTYKVSGTDANGCSGSATVAVNVGTKTTIIPSASMDSICAGASSILSASGAYSYRWLPTSGLNTTTGSSVTASPSVTTTYTITGYDAGGCSGDTTLIVTVNPTPVIVVNNATVCRNNSAVLTATGAANYSWSPLSGLSSVTGNTVTGSPVSTMTYTITGINSNGCSGSATAVIQVNDNPVVHVAQDKPSVCIGSSVTISASGARSFSWSPAPGLNTVTGSTVTASPSVTTTYSVTGINADGCSGSTTAVVTVSPVPSIGVSSDKKSICYSSSATVTATGGNSYTWKPSTGLNTTTGNIVSASPLTNMTYTVTGTDKAGCVSFDTVHISVNPSIVLNLHSSDNAICYGDSVSLSVTGATHYSWLPLTGLYTNTGSPVTVVPTTSMTYTVTGYDSNGCSGKESIFVKVNALPTLYVSSNTSSVCTGTSAVLTASGALSYFWNPSTGLSTTSGNFITAIPTSSLTYTVTGIDINGCSAQNHISLAVHPKPIFNISVNDPVICSGTSTILSADGILNYHWSPATGLNSTTGATVTASPLNTSSYTVTGTDLNGCSSSATAIVKIQPNPEITVELSTSSLCSGQSVRIQSGGALAYEWTPSTGLSSTTGSTVTASPSLTTTYHIKGTDTMGCSNSASVTVVVHPIPEVTLLPFNPVVCKGNSVPITVNGAAAYSWFPSTGLSSTSGSTVMASPTANTTYSITGTDTNGCTGSALATVEAGDVVALSVTSSQPILCEGQIALLSAAGADYYHWFPSTGLNATTGNEVTANPSSSQDYTVTGINKSGCADTASIILSVHINPVVTVSMDAAICAGSSAPLNATGDGSFSWAPGTSLSYPFIPNPTASPSVTTTYTVRVTNTVGCVTADSVVVTVHNNPAVDAGRDTLICKGDFIHLQGRGERYFKWLPQDFLSDSRISDPVCTPSYNITYTLTVTDEFGCSNIDTVQIFLKDSLNIHASPGATVCEGGVVQLFATGGNSYKWTPQEGLDNPYIANPIASPLQTTSYTVTSSDGICFTASDVSVVTVNPQPYLSVSADAEIVSGQNYQLYAYGSSNGTFVWSPPEFLSCTDCSSPTVIHPDKPMTYTVSMVDSNGCRREGEVKISLTCSDDAVYVPDAFTPNGDRRNDIFRVRSYGLQHVTYFRVFSRWGELVFETTDLNQGWDGTFKDQLCSPAVYVWYLEGVCSDGSAILKKGNVTLIR